MKYTTTNEFTHFNFSESYIQDIQIMEGLLHFHLDNVTILPENSCNRDIREMRANNFLLKMKSYTIELILEEGYQQTDAQLRRHFCKTRRLHALSKILCRGKYL